LTVLIVQFDVMRCPPGKLLYPLARTGPVVPAHAGDDQEQEVERDL
jgi:hypothetical protein